VDTDEYVKAKRLAWVFILIWPIAMPLLFLAVLLPSHTVLRARRTNHLVRATAFLHSEYATAFYWWEVRVRRSNSGPECRAPLP
jgi:hypothetical protein